VEIYGKPSWAINDYLTIGAEFFYSWASYNADALFSGGYAKLSLPGTGFSVSGAFGHYFLGMGDATFWPSFIQPGIRGILAVAALVVEGDQGLRKHLAIYARQLALHRHAHVHRHARLGSSVIIRESRC
jgi:hypothetical protein